MKSKGFKNHSYKCQQAAENSELGFKETGLGSENWDFQSQTGKLTYISVQILTCPGLDRYAFTGRMHEERRGEGRK